MLTQSKIGDLLHLDHMATLEVLQTLEDFLRRQGRTVPDSRDAKVRDLLGRVLAVIGLDVGKHFGFEENHLFPLFLQQGESGIVGILTQEHAAILPLANSLSAMIAKALEAGFTPVSWGMVRELGAELAEREIFHIQKEEMGLLAAISMLIKAEDDEALARKYKELQSEDEAA